MKKFCTLLSLVLLFLTGSVSLSAQDLIYEVGEPVLEISTDQDYVLRAGVNTDAFANKGKYLNNSNGFTDAPNVNSVYRFVEAGSVTVDGVGDLKTYALFNVANQSYLTESATYTRSISDAFVFTAALAKAGTVASWDGSLTFKDFYNLVQESQCADAVGVAFVFCKVDLSATAPRYLCFGNELIIQYYNVNNWFVCPVTSREKTAREKFDEAFNSIFPNGFDAAAYVVGTLPGCVSQTALDNMQAAYNYAFELSGNLSATDEELLACVEQMYAAQEQLEASVVAVTPGYYIFRSQRSNDAVYDDGANVRGTTGYEIPETLTADDARYVWQAVDAGDGRLYLKNFATERYMDAGAGTSVIFTTSEEPTATFNFSHITGRFMGIQDQNGNWGHIDAQMKFVQWNSTGAGNQFEVTPVDGSSLEGLRPAIEQNKLNAALQNLVSDVEAQQPNYRFDSDVTFDDKYQYPGLADPTLMKTNAPEANEGYAVENQFTQLSDGNLQTYFHTTWSNNNPTTYHYLQVDLGKAVQNLFIKFSERHNNSDGSPRYVAFVTNDDPEAEVWTDTLRKDSVFYDYATNFSAGVRDSSTAVMRISFKKPVQHLRFAVIYTNANGIHGGGPCWYVSEMRFYEDGGDNPRLALIPQEVKDELARSLAAAKTELEAGAATQATIDALQAAWEAFVAAYPDPRPLASLIADARAMTEGAVEGDQVGYYAEGSVETLNAKLDEIEAAMDGATLSLQQLADYTAQVNAAVLAFKNSFNIPEAGYYRIISTSPSGASLDSYIYATANSEAATARWAYAGDENIDSRLDAIWYLSRNEDGTVSFRNVATGLYLGNNFEDAEDPASVGLSVGLNYSLEPDTFRIGYAGTEGLMNIEMYDGRWINAAPGGGIVNWNGANSNSCFDFEPVDESVFLGEAYVNFPAAGMQIMCLPYDVDGGWLMPMAHKVLGMRTDADGQTYIEMSLYEEGETLTAGTPFVINPEEETSLYAMLTAMTLDEVMNGNHGYEPVEANGMVSAPSAVVPGQGNGLLVDGRVVILAEGESVAAGTGYFTDRIPATDEVGDLSIPVDGVINAIGGATLTDAAAEVDVYTLSGVKVRAKVKASEATKGLPAGLYIVGGQKVLVK